MTAAARRDAWRYEPPRQPTLARMPTQREWDVAFCVRSGHNVKQIATMLGISPRTVEKHLANLAALVGETRSPLATVRLHCERILAARAPLITED